MLVTPMTYAQVMSLPEPKTEYVKPGKSVEVRDKNGRVLTVLAENTKVQPIVLNTQMEPYKPNLGQKPYYTPAGNIAYGYMHNGQLGIVEIANLTTVKPTEPKQVITPDTSLFLLNQDRSIKRCEPNDLPTNIVDMVRLFHETTCNNLRMSNSTRADLIKKWEQFIFNVKAKSGDAGRLAEEAMRVDLATRTVLYESHPSWMGQDMGQCEWDVIALTLRNRADLCKKHYGCRFKGDVVGVATSPSQYNIWRDGDANGTFIGSCFLRPDLRDGEYLNLEDDEKAFFRRRVIAFENAVKRTHQILSVSEYELRDQFDVLSYDGNSDPTPEMKSRGLRGLRHYFHPEAMGQCYPSHYKDTRWVTAAYVEHRYTSEDGTPQSNYSLIRRRRVLPQSQVGDSWSFFAAEIFEERNRNREMTYAWNENTYGNGVLPASVVFKYPNDSNQCTYRGTHPECSVGETHEDHTYRKMKQSWFNPKHGGKSISIQCRIPKSCSESDCPRFNGRCDSRMILISEMY